MTTESQQSAALPGGPWQPLDVVERRVLGVLIEKQKTTSDSYPMSINGLVSGCNQKSNRDPVLTLDEDEIQEALERLLRRDLVERAPSSGRVERWRHLLYVAWQVEKVDMAIVGELLLRGPQTEGELRTRASRMDPIEDLDTLRTILRRLVQRGFVVYLTPEDRRGAVLTHGFHEPAELRQLKTQAGASGASPAPAPARAAPPPASAPVVAAPAAGEKVAALESALGSARQEIAALREQVQGLSEELEDLRREVRDLKEALGV
jgi:uncharacterized protein YceH (UPF0502 family)